jgi:cell division septation protein DedD
MFRWGILVGILIPCAATDLLSQATARPIDPAFVRAQALVSDGNGAAGRALIDSVLAATPTNAPLYAQGLFWRATLASNAADAESDYKHIVVDYPLAPQAEDALLRLAQLELARGDRDAALSHLQRIPRDYPRSKSLARASYWTARVLFEKNDIPNACAANANALSQASADEIELRNQIQYQGQRCPSTPTTVATQPTSPDSTTPLAAGPAKPAPATPANTGSSSPSSASVDTTTHKATVSSGAASIEAKTAKSEYSVQVAAYNHKVDAEKLASGLVKRGYQARVDGGIVPFRVRIGRYSNEKEAEEALKKIKAKHMDGFVVRAPQR